MTVTDIRPGVDVEVQPPSTDPRVEEIDAALKSGRYLQYADLLTAERSRLLGDSARKILAA
jgi:hypothetical protein